MRHRWDVILLWLGSISILPLLLVSSTRAGFVTKVDTSAVLDGRDRLILLPGLGALPVQENTRDWPPVGAPSAAASTTLNPGNALVSFAPGEFGDPLPTGIEIATVSNRWSSFPLLPGFDSFSMLSRFCSEAIIDGTRAADPGKAVAPQGDPEALLLCTRLHVPLGLLPAASETSLEGRLLLLCVAVTSVGLIAAVCPRPAARAEPAAPHLAAGDEAVLESPGSKSIWLALDEETMGAIVAAQERENIEEFAFLMARKRMIRVRTGTRVEVLRPPDTLVRVSIRNGPDRGVEAWVQRAFVRRVRTLPRYQSTHAAFLSTNPLPGLDATWQVRPGVLPGGIATRPQKQPARADRPTPPSDRDRSRPVAPDPVIGTGGSEFARG